MNGMMLQTDNDNFAFAINVVRWLREGPDGTMRARSCSWSMARSSPISTLTCRELTPPPIPIPPVKMLDRLIRGMEDERLFHRFLYRISLGENRIADRRSFLRSRHSGFSFTERRNSWKARFHLETGVPRMVGAASRSGPAGPASATAARRTIPAGGPRQRGLFARARLAASGVRHRQPEQWSADTPIEFRTAGAFWSRWGLQCRGDEVLRLARGAEPAPGRARSVLSVDRILDCLDRGCNRQAARIAR